MIHELSGDILLSKAKAVVHGIAPNDDFHHGLALQLRERMPAMCKDFRHFCQTNHPKSGNLWTWMSADSRFIVNLYQKGVKANEPT
jgi:O-acetyl-ADP-ribose deacetylase (regulator of RNase III)